MVQYGSSLSIKELVELARPSEIKRISVSRDKINPFFEKCLNYIEKTDEEWVNIFQNAVLNKFPRFFKYVREKNTLFFSWKRKKENMKIPEDAKEATREIIRFLKDNGRIFSKKDLKGCEKKAHKKIEKWSDIKSQSVKDNLIANYAHKLVLENSLPDVPFYVKIRSSLHIAISLSQIKDEHIVIKDERIKRIKNVKWDQEGKFLSIGRERSKMAIGDHVSKYNYFTNDNIALSFVKKNRSNFKTYIKNIAKVMYGDASPTILASSTDDEITIRKNFSDENEFLTPSETNTSIETN